MHTANKQHPYLLESLRSRVSGSVVGFGESEYDPQRTPWLQVVEQHPAVIVNATNVEDIQVAVETACRERLPFGVQNTGHGIARACDGGILLRLSEMKAVSINPKSQTAVVQPGVSSGELLSATEPHGLVYPSGQVSNVGVIGYTLGGGLGWIGRKVGPACRAIRAATVVLADGSVVTSSETEHPELLWALRGGGGNFGVVASLTLDLVRLPQIFGGMAYYSLEDAPEVLDFYRKWTSGLGNDTSTIVRLMKLPPKPQFLVHGLTETCAIGVCHTDGATADQLHRHLLAFKKPVVDDLKMRSLSEMAAFDEASEAEGSPTYGHLECLEELTDEVCRKLVRLAQDKLPPLMQIELQHLGGELSAENGAMAYSAPQAPFFLHMVSPAINATLEELAVATKEAFHSLGPVYTGEVSYNFLRGDQQARVPAAFGHEKYVSLQSLKQRFDPDNLFQLNMNIPPAVGAST